MQPDGVLTGLDLPFDKGFVVTALQISDDLVDWFNARWFGEMGAIDGRDVAFIADQITKVQPRTVVEIGCASGMSTCILAALMAQNGGGAIHSFDLLQNYYVDPTKPVGYLVDEALPHPGVTISVNRGKTCLDVGTLVTDPLDLCFIDAAHRHPWPLIDTLAVLPFVRQGGIIIHHDLKMYHSTHANSFANGPKHVLDQAPPASRIYADRAVQDLGAQRMQSRKERQNIFALRVPEDKQAFGAKLCDGFYLGWDTQPNRLVPLDFARQFRAFLTEHHTPWVVRSWDEGMRRYSPPEELPVPPPAPPQPALAQRLLRRLTGR
jgi:hypothetical protein